MGFEVWKLDAKNNYTWVNITTTGSIPSPRSDYSIWILKDIVYLFGGAKDFYNTIYSDFYSFNISTLKWSFIAEYEPFGNTSNPGRISGAATWVDSDTNALWSFGSYGGGNSQFLNDVFCYNVSANTWAWYGGGSGFLQKGIKGAIGEASKNYIPTSCWYAQAVADKKGNAWYVDRTTFFSGRK